MTEDGIKEKNIFIEQKEQFAVTAKREKKRQSASNQARRESENILS